MTHAGTHAIEGQFEHRLLTAQFATPVRQLTGQRFVVEPFALPGRKIAVLDRFVTGSVRGRRNAQFGPIRRNEFIDEHTH
ncbi:hypothetical protein YK56LOC_36190 [Caballeronia sp. HLA56]